MMLSVVINVKNGEKYLVRTLNALTRFDEVILFDNFSTDKTLEIAKTYYNVQIIQEPFCGMGKVRNLAAKYTKYDWILAIDCDEIIHHKLVEKILASKFQSNTVYQVLRYNFYDNLKIDGASWDNDWVTRIYNKNDTQFTESDVHESVNLTNQKIVKIHEGFIYHFPYDNVSQLIDKMQFYSSLYAKQNFGYKKAKLYSLPIRVLIMFIKCYILKRGYKFGYEGFVISCYNAIGVFSKYIKLYELSYKCKVGLIVKISSLDEAGSLVQYLNRQTYLPEFVWLLNTGLTEVAIKSILSLIKSDLVIPSLILHEENLDLKELIPQLLLQQSQINKIIHCDISKLSKINSLKLVKDKMIKAKSIPGYQVF